MLAREIRKRGATRSFNTLRGHLWGLDLRRASRELHAFSRHTRHFRLHSCTVPFVWAVGLSV